VSLGSGALLICDENTCVVDLARVLLNFFRNESCGKCNPCRVGSRILIDTLDKIISGDGEPGDVEVMRRAADTMARTSLCGLGQTASNPLINSLHYFLPEYEAHITGKYCPAAECAALVMP
jgi:NADH-quinone oxidoreductase subunit F